MIINLFNIKGIKRQPAPALYSLTDQPNELCSDGNIPLRHVENEIDCRKAFPQAQQRFGNIAYRIVRISNILIDDDTRPTGCHVIREGNNHFLEFNTNLAESRHIDAWQVCRESRLLI